MVSAYNIVGELSYIIAGPIFILGIGGAYLDKYLGTAPGFMLGGFVLSFFVSGYGVWTIIQRLNAADAAREKAKKESVTQTRL